MGSDFGAHAGVWSMNRRRPSRSSGANSLTLCSLSSLPISCSHSAHFAPTSFSSSGPPLATSCSLRARLIAHFFLDFLLILCSLQGDPRAGLFRRALSGGRCRGRPAGTLRTFCALSASCMLAVCSRLARFPLTFRSLLAHIWSLSDKETACCNGRRRRTRRSISSQR